MLECFWFVERCIGFCSNPCSTRLHKGFYFICGLIHMWGGGHIITKRWKEWVGDLYASKGLSLVQKKFHPMEGECYALVWGIMHFKQYLYIVTISHSYLTINLWSGWLWYQCLWMEGQMDQYTLRFQLKIFTLSRV